MDYCMEIQKMNVCDMGKLEKRVNETLKIFSQGKINMPCDEVESKLKEIEREEYKEKFFKSMLCNLITCRYNQSGKCNNEEKRKECVEVSKRVLCLEDGDNGELDFK